MRAVTILATVLLVPVAAWANLGLPNELANPGFESTSGWTITTANQPPLLSPHIAYSGLAQFGVQPAPGGGSYCGGVAGQSIAFAGGLLSQVVDESLYPGWDETKSEKVVEVDFRYFQYSLAGGPMTLNVYLDWMSDGSYPNEQSPSYVRQLIKTISSTNSGGWQLSDTEVTLPVQPRWLSVDFEFVGFTGTAINVVDLTDLQGQCIPEPATLSLLALGGLAMMRRRRH
jgi:hypothetical protein